MFDTLPDVATAMTWEWSQFEPYYEDLLKRDLNAPTITDWLHDWSKLAQLIGEVGSKLHLAYDLNTTDPEIERRFFAFLDKISPYVQTAENNVQKKLLESGLEPEGLEIALRNLRTDVELFREENIALVIEEQKVGTQYDKLIGAQTVEWEGQEIAIPRLIPVYLDPDRDRRERAWRLARGRQLQDRAAISDIWKQLLDTRVRIAANAGFSNYRDFVWKDYKRFDYTPDDCLRFHDAIEQVVVPAVARLYDRHRARLNVKTLRPWDLIDGNWGRPTDPAGVEPLRPYRDTDEFFSKSLDMYRQVDPQLGDYYEIMVRENLMDVENRTGKAPGGYCTYFPVQKRPFIFMNSVGTHGDVQIMMHEAGHAFHEFEKMSLPYYLQRGVPMEFNEVASMSMELLAAPYLQGGFYSDSEAARARVEHLEEMLLFWNYMAVVDAWQHWAYTHVEDAADTAQCDAQWRALWGRFMSGVDWSGLDAELETGWQRRLHIFRVPFYYVEYGLAALGAAQVWRNARVDQAGTVANYRKALALGGTKPLRELYQAAGAKLAFDAGTLTEIVGLIETTIVELEETV